MELFVNSNHISMFALFIEMRGALFRAKYGDSHFCVEGILSLSVCEEV